MAFKTEVELDAEVASLLADNSSGDITEAVMRTFVTDLKDSVTNMGTHNITATTVSKTLAIDTDAYTMADPTGGDIDLTLPDATTNTGKIFVLKRVATVGNAVCILTTGSDTIDGASTFPLEDTNDALVLLSDGGTDWHIIGESTKRDHYDSIVIVKESADFGVIDSTKSYFIDGIIDMTGVSIEIPTGGISVVGTTFGTSQLVCSDASYDMFTSPVGGSGNIFMRDLGIQVDGTTSQVWNIVSNDGSDAFEFNRVSYNSCTKIGIINGYSQGVELDTGRFGGTPTMELAGTWAGGFRITTSLVRGLDAGMTDALFKAGAGFTMASRFLTDINCDLPALAPFADFAPSNFVNPSKFQLRNILLSRDGVINPMDSNLLPNITPTDIASSFIDSEGIQNTFVGGRDSITTSANTPLTVSTWTPVLGTFTASDLQHFDSPSNGQLRHLGSTPRDFRVSSSGVIAGTAGDEISIKFVVWDDSVSTFSDVPNSEQTRFIQNSHGSADAAYFTIICHAILDQNDYMRMEIKNSTSSDDAEVEASSFFLVEAR